MNRTCTSLQHGEQVVFNIFSDIYEKKIPMYGDVEFVNKDEKKVWVSWFEGYKCRFDFVPFTDMVAVYNPEGEMMKFDSISGKSDLLIPE